MNENDFLSITNLFKSENRNEINELLIQLVPYIKFNYSKLNNIEKSNLALLPILLIDQYNQENINIEFIKKTKILNDFIEFKKNYKQNNYIFEENYYLFSLTKQFIKQWIKKEKTFLKN